MAEGRRHHDRSAGRRTRGSVPRRPEQRRGTRASRLRRGIGSGRASNPVSVLGLSTTRRAALVAIVVCALAFTIAVPLRTYLSQRAEVTEQQEQQEELEERVGGLQQRQQELHDPAQIEVEARHRLGYVMPGQTPYIVHPADEEDSSGVGTPFEEQPEDQDPWYSELWNDLIGEDAS